MEYTIRRAKKEDAPAIANLYFQFWKPHTGIDPLIEFEKKTTLKKQVENARKDILKKGNYILVAETQNGRIVGFIEFFTRDNDEAYMIKKYGYLNSAATDYRYRGKGIARALLQQAMEFFRKKGIKYVRTNVYNMNSVAMKTWTSLGFVPQSTLLIKKID